MLLKSLLILCCLVLIQAAVVPKEEDENSEQTVRFLNDVELAKFLAEHPDAVELNRTVTKLGNSSRADLELYATVFTEGERHPRDVRVQQDYIPWTWFGEYKNPELFVKYPQSGTGKIVTYVHMYLETSSGSATAYIVNGGIGKRSIQILIHGYYTCFWHYDVIIRGMP